MKYTILPPVGDRLQAVDRPLSEFVEGLPCLRYGERTLPPYQVLNEVFSLGVDDAGMGGGAKWNPFGLSRREYASLKRSLTKRKTHPWKYIQPPKWVVAFREWRAWNFASHLGISPEKYIENHYMSEQVISSIWEMEENGEEEGLDELLTYLELVDSWENDLLESGRIRRSSKDEFNPPIEYRESTARKRRVEESRAPRREQIVQAINDGNRREVVRLIDCGLDIDGLYGEYNSTPLIMSCLRLDESLVTSLIKNGAKVNLFAEGDHMSHVLRGYTALHAACDVGPGYPFSVRKSGANNAYSIVERLLKAGAHVDDLDSEGATPLMHAVGAGAVPIVILLLDCGAYVNSTDKHGRTALMHRCFAMFKKEVQDLRVIRTLLAYGADTTVTNTHGRTALDEAIDSRNMPAAELLLSNPEVGKWSIEEDDD